MTRLPRAWASGGPLLGCALACSGMFAGLSGCTNRETGGSRPQSADATASSVVAALPELSFEGGSWPAELRNRPLWHQAAADDDWAVVRLGRGESTTALLHWLGLGGPAARAAARTYPTTAQAWAWRGEFCEVMARYEPRAWSDLLEALNQSVEQAQVVGEVLDPAGDQRCQRVLGQMQQRIARDRAHDPALSDWLESALQMLELSAAGSDLK